jgi:hypothetical protein
MMLPKVGCAILASALLSATAFALPEPTQRFAVQADNWSPAPTAAPQFNILGRDASQSTQSNTCGFVSGLLGTYSQPYGLNPASILNTDPLSIARELPQLQRRLRNKHLLRRARLLQPVGVLPLHNRHNMHPFRRHDLALHRQQLLLQCRHRKMHCQLCTGVLQVALRLRNYRHDAAWLHG